MTTESLQVDITLGGCMSAVNTLKPQIYLGLMFRIWASLGLESSTFSIFTCILLFLVT